MIDNMTNIIYVKELKWQKNCSKCGKPIKKGYPCYWDKDEKNVNYHIDCYDANPKLESEPVASTKATEKSVGVSIEETVSNRLAKAREIVQFQIPNAQDYADYLIMVSEIAHQLFSEESQRRIQKYKQKNLETVTNR